MPILSSIAILLAAAAAEESLWDVFARTRIPAASKGEDTTGLEVTLETLKTQDTRCRDRLANKDAIKRRLDIMRTDRETVALEDGFDEVRTALQGVDPEASIKALETPGTSPFSVQLSGATGPRAVVTLSMASTVFPTLDLDRVESGPQGWTGTGRLALVSPRPRTEEVADAPPPAKKEGRRSSELRLRVAAARPMVQECQRKLADLGLLGGSWYVTRASMPRPRGGALRPLLDRLAQARFSDPVTLEAASDGTVRISTPLASAERLAAVLEPMLARLSIDERIDGTRAQFSLTLERPLSSWMTQPTGPRNEALGKIVAAYRELHAARASIAFLADPSLESATQAALSAAESAWPALVETATAPARTEALAARIQRLGVPMSTEEFRQRLEACNVQLEGRGPTADGKPSTVVLTSAHPESGPHPFACLRSSVSSIKHVRFEWSARVSRSTVKVTLPAPAAAGSASPAILPLMPEPPKGPAATPEVTMLRTKLGALHDRVEELRAQLPATAEFASRWAAAQRLATVAKLPPASGRFYDAVFADASKIGAWVDFTARGEVFDLNVNPKERSRGMLDALSAAGCTTIASKDAAGGLRATFDCTPR